jgi:two-component system chemotaxis response regulator CheY
MPDSTHRRLPSLRGARVLLVDSNRPMLSLFREVVRSAGAAEVYDCTNAVSALEVCKSQRPDAALVEYELTDMSGLEFLRLIRNSSDTPVPKLAVVMMSGIRERAVVQSSIDAGADSFLLKPVSATVIAERLKAALGKRGWYGSASTAA